MIPINLKKKYFQDLAVKEITLDTLDSATVLHLAKHFMHNNL